MSKARARERAKAKAGQKAKKRATAADQADQNVQQGKFDIGGGSIKAPGGNARSKNFGGARRQAARSR